MRTVLFGAEDPSGKSPSGALGQTLVADTSMARILIVEDEWLVSMEAEAALEDAGYQVVGIAASANEALTLAELYRPNLILMDIRINGDRDGVEAALEIYARLGIRSIFVSAHADGRTKERAQSARPLDWVTKPYSSPQLIQSVTAALQGQADS